MFLGTAGVEADRVSYRLYIHESADVSAAEQYWMTITGAESAQFKRPVLKRHNPKTVRKQIGDDYHGCLTVTVLQPSSLYRRVDGWWRGILAARAAGGMPD